MRELIVIAFCIVFGLESYGQNIEENLKNDSLIMGYFEKKDLPVLIKIVNLYDDWAIEKTGVSEINAAYHKLAKDILKSTTRMEIANKSGLTSSELDSIISLSKKHWTFYKIWRFEYGWNYHHLDTVNVALGQSNEYTDFLKKLADSDDSFLDYIESIEAFYAIPPTELLFPALNHEKMNFRKPHWRLFFAIHFITINYESDYIKAK